MTVGWEPGLLGAGCDRVVLHTPALCPGGEGCVHSGPVPEARLGGAGQGQGWASSGRAGADHAGLVFRGEAPGAQCREALVGQGPSRTSRALSFSGASEAQGLLRTCLCRHKAVVGATRKPVTLDCGCVPAPGRRSQMRSLQEAEGEACWEPGRASQRGAAPAPPGPWRTAAAPWGLGPRKPGAPVSSWAGWRSL